MQFSSREPRRTVDAKRGNEVMLRPPKSLDDAFFKFWRDDRHRNRVLQLACFADIETSRQTPLLRRKEFGDEERPNDRLTYSVIGI